MKKKSSDRRKVRYSPTQKDIADALGVAQSTVAMALNPTYEHRLLAETVERIKNYAAEVGYHPQRFAQIMQGGRTHIVGVVVRLGIYSSTHEMVSMLANALNRAGYRLVLVDPVWFGGDPESVRRYLLDQGVEGVVFCNVTIPNESDALQAALPADLPLIGVQNTQLKGTVFRQDLETAYYNLTRLHLALGSQKLALLSSFRDSGMIPEPTWTLQERFRGFARAIQEAGGNLYAEDSARELIGIPGCRSLPARMPAGITGTIIYPERNASIPHAYANGFHETLKLIDSAALPDSIVCANDDMALGALAACSDRGIQVPEAVRISGHDGTTAGEFGAVPLTTASLPMEEMVQATAKELLALLRNTKTSEPRLKRFHCMIRISSSCASGDEVRRLIHQGFFHGPGGKHFEWRADDRGLRRLDTFSPCHDNPQPTPSLPARDS